MKNKKTKVAINGYGVIGKRIADAVRSQPDMEVVGVSDVITDWRIKIAVQKQYPLYASTAEALSAMKDSGLPVLGTLDDLIENADIVCDAAPKKIASTNFEKYNQAHVKSIFQGGEKHSLTGHSFTAQANYETAIGRDSTRVVSCNTTSIVRVLGALNQAGILSRAHGVLVRRATDPWESDISGVMNTIVPEVTIPSHQGPDAQTVIPELNVTTVALVASETISHFHTWHVELNQAITKEEVLKIFAATPRIIFLVESDGLNALNDSLELMSDLNRPRGDMWEVGLWKDSLTVKGTDLFFNYQVYNQAIVIPETIDAIRALTGIETNPTISIEKTNKALGVLQGDILSKVLVNDN